MGRLTRDGTAEPISRDQVFRREQGQRIIILPCSADHEQDWQPFPVDPYPCYIGCQKNATVFYVFNSELIDFEGTLGVSIQLLVRLMCVISQQMATFYLFSQ